MYASTLGRDSNWVVPLILMFIHTFATQGPVFSRLRWVAVYLVVGGSFLSKRQFIVDSLLFTRL